MTRGIPEDCPSPPSEIGGVILKPFGLRVYKPEYAVVSAKGIVEASSYETLGGI